MPGWLSAERAESVSLSHKVHRGNPSQKLELLPAPRSGVRISREAGAAKNKRPLKRHLHAPVRPSFLFFNAIAAPCRVAVPHFLTATINPWLPLFSRPHVVVIVLNGGRFLRRDSGFQPHGDVILENHPPWIAASPDLTHDMQRCKSYRAQQIIAFLQRSRSARALTLLKRAHKTESDYPVCEEGSHRQCIDRKAVMRQ